MAKKKPINLWSKIAFLFMNFSLLVSANCYYSDLIIEKIKSGLQVTNSIFSLNYVKNTGAAFSILQDSTILLIILSLLALIFLFTYVIRHAGTMSMHGIFWIAVMTSGVFCNMLERIHFGYVRDFIDLMFIDFPVFNFSDIAINVSLVVIIILLLKRTQLKQL